MSQDITQRSITSTAWNAVASLTGVLIGFVRSILLARLLPVEVFGIYALAGSVVSLSSVFAAFGMGGAFLHRAPETQDEDHAASIHFTLKLIFTSVWAALLTAGTFVFTAGQTRVALLVLTATTAGFELTQTSRLILTRRVVHRRLALIQMLRTLLITLVALGLAWQGVTLWALLSTDLVALTLIIVALYVWRPVWRPRLAWSRPVMRYYLRFGSRNLLAGLLIQTLDRVDDLWVGFYLGKTPLGFYSRAYTFATYPRRILAGPINQVVRGTYAELKGDRLGLSKAFFRINALLLRAGFFFAGLLALLASEFIYLALGEKWMPMLGAFRLMLVFTLLDPVKLAISYVFEAVGRPDQVVQARFVQLAVLLFGLFLLGPWLGIAGVALAVDVMLVVGIAIMLWLARTYVDFSVRKLLVAPGLALGLALLAAWGVSVMGGVEGDHWRAGLFKAIIFSTSYGSIWLIMERSQFLEVLQVWVIPFLNQWYKRALK